jgi:hypothetical protein
MPITLGGYDPEGKVRLSAYFDGLADVWTVRRNLRSVIYDQRLERAAPAFERSARWRSATLRLLCLF